VSNASRKSRGYATQALIAERWRELGLYPYAVDVGNGRQGVDILNTPGILAEVKATGRLSLVAQLDKLDKLGQPGVPVVLWRHNGQGPKGIGHWTATLWLEDFEHYIELLKKENGHG
jgi:hypothetical protein